MRERGLPRQSRMPGQPGPPGHPGLTGDVIRTRGLKRKISDVDPSSSTVPVKEKKGPERQLMDDGAGPSRAMTETAVTSVPAIFEESLNSAAGSRHDLYLRISQNLDDSERRDLVNYVSSSKLLPARHLQHMDTDQIFKKLHGKGQLKKGDLSLLEDLMTKIGREDLAEEAGQIASEERKDLPQVLKTISTRLTAADVKRLKHVWIARTGAQETVGMETSEDLMRTMVKRGDVSASDLGMLVYDMTAAGICFSASVQDIPGLPDELRYPKTTEAVLGPLGGEVEISGFVKLIVPPGVLQEDTIVTISTVDIPNILRDPEGVSWTSGYPWSLDEAACPRELLDQVRFSPAVDVNLHGARLSGPVELQTWRPPGSEGMGCVLLKHHDGEAWTDITASTEHHIYPDRLSVFLQTFSPVGNAWAPLEAMVTVGRMVVDALSSRTLDCRFAAYMKPCEEKVQFHVVCRDQIVETKEYLPGFTICGFNRAMFDLFHGDIIEVAVSVQGGQNDSKQMELRSKNCKDKSGQNVQMFLSRPSAGERVSGEVSVKKIQVPTSRAVCQFIIYEEGDIPPSVSAVFTEDVNMATVSRHDLYLRISQNLVDSERRDLVNYVSGTNLLPARDVEHMEPQEIFIKLEQKGKLKDGDLSLLDDLMTKIGREDLAEETRQIALKDLDP